jgi:hypothetical protein
MGKHIYAALVDFISKHPEMGITGIGAMKPISSAD